MTQQDTWKRQAGSEAARLVERGMVVGLGTGSTANFFIQALAQRIQRGLLISGAVASSQASETLARNLGIPVGDLNMHPELDLYVDGADEVDYQLRLIKGAGGALLREKIVASASRRFVVVGDTTKQVHRLGLHYPLPVEVIPFAVTPVKKHLEALGAVATLRERNGQVFKTENHHLIIDCTFSGGIADPENLDSLLHRITGVVETGLFLNMAHSALIGGPDGVAAFPDQA